MLAIIDYKAGNPGSIRNMLKKIGTEAVVTSEPDVIAKANKLILPGVGAFDYGMTNLENLGLLPVLHQRALQDRVPVLGICLGMQLFSRCSEEGKCSGLSWIDAETRKLSSNGGSGTLRIPHMGWNNVWTVRPSKLFQEVPAEPRFYFVHSYHVQVNSGPAAIALCKYGGDLVAAVEQDNIVGVQFHPEKSHKFGMKLLANFIQFY